MPFLLLLNQYFFKFSLFIAIFYICDPFDTSFGLDNNQLLKYLSTIFAFISLLFSLIININKKVIKVNKYFFMILILFLLMLFGSLYTIMENHSTIMESYLGRAIGMIFFFTAYFYYSIFNDDYKHFRFFTTVLTFYVLYIFTLFILKFLGVSFNNVYIFHEEILAVTVPSVLFFSYYNNFLGKYGLTFISIICGLLSSKLTGFISSILSTLIITIFIWNFKGKYKIVNRLILFCITISIGIFISYILLYRFHLLPSGSPEVRNQVYLSRLLMFNESPLFGTFFVGNSMVEVAWLYIPSHSDLLDILSFGGLFSSILFIAPIIKSSWHFIRNIKIIVNDPKNNFYIFNYLMLISGFLILTVNPLLNQPKLCIFFWYSYGYLMLKLNSYKRI